MAPPTTTTAATEDGDGDALASPSPATSFVLLEARDSYAHNHATIPPPTTTTTTRTAQQRPPDYEHGSVRQAPPPRSSISFQHRAAPPLAPQPRARADSLHDLFPLMHSSVFTTPDNIMPSLQDAIVIADAHDALHSTAGIHNTHHANTTSTTMTGNASTSTTNSMLGSLTVGNVTLNQHSLAGQQLSLGAIFGAAAAASVGRTGTTPASARAASCHSFADLDASASNESLTDALRMNGTRPRATPAQWLVSLYRRLNSNWDSTFLLFTLLVSVAVVPLGVGIAAVLQAHVSAAYTARCQLPFARGAHQFEVSTASFATVTIPTLNHAVLSVVSLWIAIQCSRSRARVLRSHAQSSARTNLSAFVCNRAVVSTVAPDMCVCVSMCL